MLGDKLDTSSFLVHTFLTFQHCQDLVYSVLHDRLAALGLPEEVVLLLAPLLLQETTTTAAGAGQMRLQLVRKRGLQQYDKDVIQALLCCDVVPIFAAIVAVGSPA